MNRLILFFVVAGWFFLIAGCGGSGSGSSGDGGSIANISGVWHGTWTSNSGESYEISGLISPDNEARFFDWLDLTQYAGSIQLSGASGSGGFRVYFDAVYVGTTSINFIVSGDAISGTYTANGDSGTFTMFRDESFDIGASLQEISGTWGYSIPDIGSVSFTFNTDGTLAGTSSLGCVANGSVAVINPNHNVYRLNMTISGCQDAQYSGLATIEPFSGHDDLLWLAVSNQASSVTDVLQRM